MRSAPRTVISAAAAAPLSLLLLAAPAGGARPDTDGALTAPRVVRPVARHEAAAVDTTADAVELRPSANRHGATLGSSPFGPRGFDDLHPDLHHAYWLAVQSAPESCHPELTLLAAIGMVESGNAAGRYIDNDHRVVPSLVGPPLDGVRRPAVSDSDAGQLDGDRRWDRAVGPLQLVPEVWRAAGVDMDGDGVRDPQNVFDAAGAAVVYLCARGRDLATTVGVRRAIHSFNRAPGYLTAVLDWKARYDRQRKQMTPPTLIGTSSDLTVARPGPEGVMTPVAHHRAPRRAATSPSSPLMTRGPSRADAAQPDVPATTSVPLVAQPSTRVLPPEPQIPSAAPGAEKAPAPSPAATPGPTGSATQGDVTSTTPSPATQVPSPAPSSVPVCPSPTEDPPPVDPTVPLPPEVALCQDGAGVHVIPPS